MADLKASIEKAMKALGGETDYAVNDAGPNSGADGLDRAFEALDQMADKGMELADALAEHRRFSAQSFAMMAVLVKRLGGWVEITEKEMLTEGSVLAARWNPDRTGLIVTVTEPVDE